ncbi:MULTISPECIES: DUF982 domain-containing protein [Agrobacterium]|uniref:DUF982 domain-containing protein n=1 Tax=Agrobacterium pusense TaxID=648995 RepID=U4Q5E3_9HYPH|nr:MULTISPECIES: DUF982 domain-containing protein [Agrobacterium]NRF10202.1 DUF982 domain-containing protein [Agrobacterium pusense]NRF18893.1 DUF982 domain-containing protein [Agrobacterium pusense]OOO22002.1 hypothetical protein BTE56_07755 [Agrobacterium pusense]PTV76917.1 DUF982 domain-containing protein [Agrobacterium pusense]PTV77629.1 DUF982 domain-containing protein [Agrobacterium pusense]
MNSPEVLFRAPVRVRMQCGLERSFLSVYDALDFLENEWPLRRGERYKRAVQKCRAALSRLEAAEVAREAFISACLEASMPLVMAGPVHLDEMLPMSRAVG